MQNLKVYKTNELTRNQNQGIRKLFLETFQKEKAEEFFSAQMENTVLGYSYHCICEEAGEILANYCVIPYEYTIEGKKHLVGLVVDTIVSPRANLGPFAVADMALLVEEAVQKDGIYLFIGFPNDNVYSYVIDFMNWHPSGFLEFYVAPLFPASIRKKFPFLSFLEYGSILMLRLLKLFSSSREITYPVDKVDSVIFRKGRYNEKHHFLPLKNGEAVYTIYPESFGEIAYIIDIVPFSGKNLYEAFLEVAKATRGRADMVAYPAGKLPFYSPLRVPHRFLPRKLQMAVHPLGNGKNTSPIVFSMTSWKANLSIFDVR